MIIGKQISTHLAMMMGLAAASGYGLPYALRRPDRPFKICLLHGCETWTDHNGGYCCPEHCKRHRAVTAKMKKHFIRKINGYFRFDYAMAWDKKVIKK